MFHTAFAHFLSSHRSTSGCHLEYTCQSFCVNPSSFININSSQHSPKTTCPIIYFHHTTADTRLEYPQPCILATINELLVWFRNRHTQVNRNQTNLTYRPVFTHQNDMDRVIRYFYHQLVTWRAQDADTLIIMKHRSQISWTVGSKQKRSLQDGFSTLFISYGHLLHTAASSSLFFLELYVSTEKCLDSWTKLLKHQVIDIIHSNWTHICLEAVHHCRKWHSCHKLFCRSRVHIKSRSIHLINSYIRPRVSDIVLYI